jgi:hypothetical protein
LYSFSNRAASTHIPVPRCGSGTTAACPSPDPHWNPQSSWIPACGNYTPKSGRMKAVMVLNTPLTHARPTDFLQPSPTSQTGGRFPQQPYPLSDDRRHTKSQRDPHQPRVGGFHDQGTTMGTWGLYT